jgi:MFS transporter, DHA1 family, quinolone resistance protein
MWKPFGEAMTDPTSFRLRRHRALMVLGAAQGLVALLFYVPVSALFLTSRGLSYTEIFMLEAILLATVMAAEVPTGALADRIDRKVVLCAGYGIAAAGEVMFAAGFHLIVYIGSFVLSGLAIAALSGAQEAYVYETLGERADETSVAAFGRLSAIGLAAGVLAAGTGSLLAMVDIGLPALFAAAAHVAAAGLVVAMLPARAAAGDGDRAGPRGQVRLAARTMVRSPVLLYGAFAVGTGFVIFNAVHTLNQPMFGSAGIPVGWFGLIVAGGMLGAALANNAIGQIERRTGRGPLLVMATLGGAAGYWLLAVPNPVVTVLGFAAVVLGMNLRGPVLSAIANRLVDDRQRATVLSVMSFTGSLAGVVVNLVLGAVAGESRLAAAVVSGGMLLLLGLAWLPIARWHIDNETTTVEGEECSSRLDPEPNPEPASN